MGFYRLLWVFTGFYGFLQAFRGFYRLLGALVAQSSEQASFTSEIVGSILTSTN
jgi:hypothetical protein